MAKLIKFTGKTKKSVFINPEFVIAVEQYREDATHAVIYTSGLGKGATDSRNYVVLGSANAVAAKLAEAVAA